MRKSVVTLKIKPTPRVVVVEQRTIPDNEDKFVVKGNTKHVVPLITELVKIQKKAANPYDEMWMLKGLLDEKISEQMQNTEVDKSFAIDFIKKKITDKEDELKILKMGII